jgi:hypothetical protein
MMEVIAMNTELKTFYDTDPGFRRSSAEFNSADRHGIVSANPELRRIYHRWEIDQTLNELEKSRDIAESEARGEARGKSMGARSTFVQSLPLYFTSIDVNPQYKKQVIEMGREVGVEERVILAEWEKWKAGQKDVYVDIIAKNTDADGYVSVEGVLKDDQAQRAAEAKRNRVKSANKKRDDDAR